MSFQAFRTRRSGRRTQLGHVWHVALGSDLPNRKSCWEQDPPVQVVPTRLSGLTVILVPEVVWVKINQETPSLGQRLRLLHL